MPVRGLNKLGSAVADAPKTSKSSPDMAGEALLDIFSKFGEIWGSPDLRRGSPEGSPEGSPDGSVLASEEGSVDGLLGSPEGSALGSALSVVFSPHPTLRLKRDKEKRKYFGCMESPQ